MPIAPLRGCRAAGCAAKVQSGFCDDCKRKGKAKETRPNAAQRGYDSAWQKTSAARLEKYPLCVDPYNRHGEIPQPATCTDHIIPHKGDRKLLWDSNNWQSLCNSCHGIKTAKEDGGFGRGMK